MEEQSKSFVDRIKKEQLEYNLVMASFGFMSKADLGGVNPELFQALLENLNLKRKLEEFSTFLDNIYFENFDLSGTQVLEKVKTEFTKTFKK